MATEWYQLFSNLHRQADRFVSLQAAVCLKRDGLYHYWIFPAEGDVHIGLCKTYRIAFEHLLIRNFNTKLPFIILEFYIGNISLLNKIFWEYFKVVQAHVSKQGSTCYIRIEQKIVSQQNVIPSEQPSWLGNKIWLVACNTFIIISENHALHSALGKVWMLRPSETQFLPLTQNLSLFTV
jgi:hypothetical protein